MSLTKRDLLRALAAVGALAATPAWAQGGTGIDLSGGEAIGAAYRAVHPDRAEALRTIMPQVIDAAALRRLKTRAAADFGAGRIFIYQGWRLSETEAQLFALLGAAG